jgi:hypothetical protein
MPLWAYSLARRLVYNLRRFSTPPQVEAKRIASPTSFGGAERDAKWLQHRVAALGFDVTVPEKATQLRALLIFSDCCDLIKIRSGCDRWRAAQRDGADRGAGSTRMARPAAARSI